MRDIYGTDCGCLTRKKLWLFDMDGTIYIDRTLIDGTLELLSALRDRGDRYVFITNNSSRSVGDYLKKLADMGITANEENFFTSTQATILYLKTHFPGQRIYVQATRSCVKELKSAGLDVTEQVDPTAGVVLTGFDPEVTGEKLARTCEMLMHENVFIATNPDLVCPVSFGYVPDCGSMCQMLENATRRRPKYIGKPEPDMIDIVRQKFNISREKTAVIGDRLYTDIAAGLNADVTAVCVLSGETSEEDIRNSKWKPDLVLGSVRDIANCLCE